MLGPWPSFSGWAFLLGILVFSGSLYILALSGVRAWGAVTPLGGLAFIVVIRIILIKTGGGKPLAVPRVPAQLAGLLSG